MLGVLVALIKIADIQIEEGPMIAPDASADEAKREMERFGFDWVSVVEDGELLGWVDRPALDGSRTVAEAKPRPFSAYVTAQNSLRQALDSIVTSSTNVAVVVSEGQRYLGILTIDRLSREITQ